MGGGGGGSGRRARTGADCGARAQVDFLNEWRSTLDGELRGERAARQAAEERKGEAERVALASGEQAAALQEALTKMLAKMEGQAEQATRDALLQQQYPRAAARPSKGGVRPSSAMPARGAENKPRPRDSTPLSSAASSRRAWLAETEVAVLRAKLDESRADAMRAQRAEAAVVTLQRQLDQARVTSRATQSRARPGATDAAAPPIPA